MNAPMNRYDRAIVGVMHEAASQIHWESCGKPEDEKRGYYAALEIVNKEIRARGGKGFGE